MINYLNQVAVHKRAYRVNGEAVYDSYGNYSFDVTQNVKARIEAEQHQVINHLGELVTCGTKYYVAVPIKVNDLLDNHPVVAVEQYVNFSGSTVGYVCSV